MDLEVGTPYAEPGYTSDDDFEGDLTASVVVSGPVGHTFLGSYVLRYNVRDSSWNPAEEKTRTANVVDMAPIELTGIVKPLEGMLQLTWSSRPGDRFTVCSRTDLVAGEWVEEISITGQADSVSWMDMRANVPVKFYRIQRR